jgi:predicted DNA-binding transcriptional regulator YafY
LKLPLARLLELLMILQTERYPNARRLAEVCAVSRRTIYRDLATLDAAGIRVMYHPDRQGYQLARECLLPPLQLDDLEALALLIMSRFWQADEPFGLARHARSGLAKIIRALPPQLRDRITRCGELLPEEPAPVEIGESRRHAILHTILSSLLNRKVFRLRSRDPQTGEAISTQLAAYRIARIAGEWSLVGYSSFHGGVRIFGIRCVEAAAPIDEPYAIPPRFRMGSHSSDVAADNPGRFEFRHDVLLRFKSPAISMIDAAPAGETRCVRWDASGELELALRVEISENLVCWILGFGDQIEVIRPEELREAVRQRALSIALRNGPAVE